MGLKIGLIYNVEKCMVFFFLKIILKKFLILKVVYNLLKVKKKGRKFFKNDKNVLMYFLFGVWVIWEVLWNYLE